MNNDVNVELVQQQEQIRLLKKARKSHRIALLINYFLTVVLLIAVIYLYYLKKI